MTRAEKGCTQSQCPLRGKEVDARLLARLIVAALSGEDVRGALPPDSRIDPLPRCVECVQRVMRGQGPIETVEELLRAEEAGRWTWRRARRKRDEFRGPV